ncbi:MAG: NAD-dependent epimerase/dehydratase family protein [Calditrichia bacterium]
MKILITGGAGFIGSHIADRYLQMGHQVVIVDNLITGRRENIPEKASFYELDIRSAELENIIAKEKPDIINHHAAQMDVRKSVADPIFDADINVLGGLNLLQNCVKFKVQKVIFASTGGAIYGEQDNFPADESHPLQPLSPYGITKLATEKYLYFYFQAYGLNYTVLRYANVYGPRQNPHGEAGVVAIFSEKLLKGEQPVINGDGTQTRDYVFVEDVVSANELALQNGKNRIYNIGTSKETDVNELYHLICRALEIEMPEQHGPAKAGEQLRSVLDYRRIASEVGWKPETGLQEGIRKTTGYFKQKHQK